MSTSIDSEPHPESNLTQICRNDIIGDDLSTNNPADELEKIDLRPAGLGKFYGFPYCHTG